MARPGEFSERAFLNGKMDLVQLEAVADLISSESEQAAKNALQSLKGVFSELVHSLTEETTSLRVLSRRPSISLMKRTSIFLRRARF